MLPHVGAHGVDRDEHRGGDLLGGEQLGEMAEHLALLRRQRLDEGVVDRDGSRRGGGSTRMSATPGATVPPLCASRSSRLDAISASSTRVTGSSTCAPGDETAETVLPDHHGHARHHVSGTDGARHHPSRVLQSSGSLATWRTSTSSSPSAWSRSSTPYNAAWSGRTPRNTVSAGTTSASEVLEVGDDVGGKGAADVDLEGLRQHARHLLRSEAPTVSRGAGPGTSPVADEPPAGPVAVR